MHVAYVRGPQPLKVEQVKIQALAPQISKLIKFMRVEP